jgi:N-acyl-L-homoserine lactone synthetase
MFMISARQQQPVHRRALTDDRLSAIQRLRYEVYCLERKFRDAAEYPDGLERDEYDAHSTHICATDSTGAVVGTVRLVHHSPLGLPVQQHGATLAVSADELRQRKTAEVSRLILAKKYRRHTLDQPLLLWGLFARAYEESCRLGIGYWVAAMEEGLWRLLRRFGFPVDPIGEGIDYFGPVIPYGIVVSELAEGYRNFRSLQSSTAAGRPAIAAKFEMTVAA